MDWDVGYDDEMENFECQMADKYDQFMKENCRCACEDECECITFEEFKEEELKKLNDYWEDYELDEYEERYA